MSGSPGPDVGEGYGTAHSPPFEGVCDCSPSMGGVLPSSDSSYPSPFDISRQTLFRQVDTVFPDGSFRRTVLKASCVDVVCGEAPWCLSVCGSSGPLISKPVVLLSDEDKLRASVRRSQSQVRDITRASGLRYLLTVTAGKQFSTRSEALDAFSGYLHDPKYGRWFAQLLDHAYVVVAEPFRDGGGWHLHAAIPGFIPHSCLVMFKVTWTEYLTDRLGIPAPSTSGGLWRVEVKPPPPRSSSRSLGRYLAKYVGKHFADAYSGERRYRAGSGCKRPTRSKTLVLATNADMWLSLVELGHVEMIFGPGDRLLGWSVESHAPPDAQRGGERPESPQDSV